LILLCQGLVFENDEYPVVFIALIFVMFISGLVGAVASYYKRKMKSKTSVILTRQSLAMLPIDTVLLAFILCSSSRFEATGVLEFGVYDLRRQLRSKFSKELVLAADNTGYILKSNINIILDNLPESITAEEFSAIVKRPIPPYQEIGLQKDNKPKLRLPSQQKLENLNRISDAQF
jgi:hypothetical protein